jgi:hypothetical protein
MPLFLEFRDGHYSVDQESHIPGELGPIVGPFVSVRLLRDEVRVATAVREFLMLRVADWIYYGNRYFADISIISTEQIGSGRARRSQPFNALLADFPTFSVEMNVSPVSSNVNHPPNRGAGLAPEE